MSTWPRLTVRRLMRFIALFALVMAPVAWYWHATHRGWTESRVENLIRSEIPAGATRAEVVAWFERHGITRYPTPDPSVEYGAIGPPEANFGMFLSGQIQITYWFDADDRLLRHRLKTQFTGP